MKRSACLIKISRNFVQKVFFILALFFSCPVFSATIDSLYTDEINMVKGELETLTVYSLTRISLTDPSVVDTVNVDDKQILLIAKNPGQTTLFLWDEHGKRNITIHVYPEDLVLMRDRIERLLEAIDIEGISLGINEQEGKVVIFGNVPPYKKAQFDQVIAPFGNIILNLAQSGESEDLVQIDMQITELNGTLKENLGINWNDLVKYGETLPKFDDGTLSDLLKIGDFARSTALQAQVDAWVSEGKARVLSKPRLVVVSGKDASFLVGGQIPIRTTTTNTTGATQESVTFKDYGIGMNITPTIRKDKVDVLLKVEISDIDTTTASSIKDTIAFATRSATTQLFLDDGQLIVIAGLIKKNTSKTVEKVPFLGDIPIVGLLFRSITIPDDKDQELVISLVPHILTKYASSTGAQPAASKTSMQTQTAVAAATPASASAAAETPSSPPASTPAGTKEEPAPTTNSLPAASPGTGIPPEMLEYVKSVQQKISQAIDYPKEALENGWEGTVKVGLLILRDGTLASASIKEASGYAIFDEYTLNASKNTAPYSGFPASTSLQEINVTIPIVYSLKKD